MNTMQKVVRRARHSLSQLYSRKRLILLAIDCRGRTATTTSSSVRRTGEYENDDALRKAMLETDHWNPAEIQKRKQNGDRCYQVFDGSTCVHYSWVSRKTLAVDEVGFSVALPSHERWIYDGYTSPAYRGKSIFKTAIDAMLNDAAAEGCDTVWIGVEENNHSSRRAILKAGFVEVALLKRTFVFSRPVGTLTYNVLNKSFTIPSP